MAFDSAFLARLVSFRTDADTKEGYSACADFLEAEAKNAGFRVIRIEPDALDGKPRPNLVIELDVGAPETLLLVTHYDVVGPGEGWSSDPWKLRESSGKVFGRGVVDDKGAIALAFAAMKELHQERFGGWKPPALFRKLSFEREPGSRQPRLNVKLVVSCDEEARGEYGLKYLCQHNPELLKANYAIALDGRREYLGIACSGVISAKIRFKGVQGHAAYPHKVWNVLHAVIGFLPELLEYRKQREKAFSRIDAPVESLHSKIYGRFSVTMLHAGHKTNVIPSGVEIGCDIRTIPEEDVHEVEKEFRGFVESRAKAFGVEPEFEFHSTNGYHIQEDAKIVQMIRHVYKKMFGKELETVSEMGGSDSRFLAQIGIPAIGFMPSGENVHGADENITLHELETCKEILKEICRHDYRAGHKD